MLYWGRSMIAFVDGLQKEPPSFSCPHVCLSPRGVNGLLQASRSPLDTGTFQRGVPEQPAGGNPMPSLGSVKELIVPCRWNGVNIREERTFVDGETRKVHTNRFLRFQQTARRLLRPPKPQHQHLLTSAGEGRGFVLPAGTILQVVLDVNTREV